MSIPDAFTAVKEALPDAEYWEEGGLPYVFIPRLCFESGGKKLSMPAVLCPAARDSYPTRLFLEKQVAAKGQNWKAHVIRGHSWWAFSWNEVPASLPWLQILANHLRAMQ